MSRLDARVAQASRIAARVVDGRAVVVVVDTRELHTLNEVGTFVWEALSDGPLRVAEIVDAVAREFEVDRSTAEADVARFVAELERLGALEVREGGQP